MSNRGQAFLEALICLPVVLLVFTLFAYGSYRFLVFIQADYHTHEALICFEYSPSHQCQQKLNHKLNGILVFQESLKLSHHLSEKTLTIEIQLHPPLIIRKKRL